MAIGPKVRVLAAALALSASGLAFITQHEGKENVPYYDSVGVPTVCYGHTGKVDMRRYYSDEECAALLSQDTHWAVKAVRSGIRVPIYQSQFDALVDFCFNVGAAACKSSRLFALTNELRFENAAEEFKRWKFAKGVDCSVRRNNCWGVWQRRLDEYLLYTQDI